MVEHQSTRPPNTGTPLISAEAAVGWSPTSSRRGGGPIRATSGGSIKLLIEPDHFTATILIDRRLNRTLTNESLTQLGDCLTYIAGSVARVVIIRRPITHAPTTGTEIAPPPPQLPTGYNTWRRWQPLGHSVFDQLATLPQPTIAVVNGLTLGCGLELALACKHRFADPDANIGPTATGLGTLPGRGDAAYLTRLVGPEHVQGLIAADHQLDATTAASWGLLTRIVPADDLESAAYSYAQELSQDAEPVPD